jgi:paraquat-inducible protein B
VSKKINPTSVGLFIVTGVALGVIGLMLFSTSKMFSTTRDLIVYFDGSLNGLKEGAPFKYRGVTIGSVKRVMVRFNQSTNSYMMPVIIEMEEELLRERLGDDYNDMFTEASLEHRINRGLRASLLSESMVTGVLYVGADMHPDAPPPVFHQLVKLYPELPSIPTQTQQLLKNLSSFDIKGLEKNLNSLITKIETAVSGLRTEEINDGVTNLLASIDRLVTSPDITNALASIRPTLEQYRELGAKLTGKVDPLSDSITNSLADASRALDQLRGASANLRVLIAPDSPVSNDLSEALQQIGAAGDAIASFVEFLKRNPNALIVGREILPAKKP